MMTETPSANGVRASDAERDQVAALLQRHYEAGRLTTTELDERLAAAYAARTRRELDGLIADLPADLAPAIGSEAEELAPWLQCLLWCVFPPAGLAYWMYARRVHRRPAEIAVLPGR
jgi:hypothetical protein